MAKLSPTAELLLDIYGLVSDTKIYQWVSKRIGLALHKINLTLKARFTPKLRDAVVLTAYLGSIYLWPMPLLLLTGCAAIITASVELLTHYLPVPPGKKAKSMWLLDMMKDHANEKLFQKTKDNSISLIEAQWLLQPGLFLPKAGFYGLLDIEGTSVLHWAAYHDREDLIDCYLSAGTKLCHENLRGQTALDIAVIGEKLKAIDLLMQVKGKVVEKTHAQATELAVRHDKEKSFNKLLECGAWEHLEPAKQFEIVKMAVQKGNINILLLLERNGKNALSDDLCKVAHARLQLKRKHIEKGYHSNTLASVEAYANIVTYLTGKGYKPPEESETGSAILVSHTSIHTNKVKAANKETHRANPKLRNIK